MFDTTYIYINNIRVYLIQCRFLMLDLLTIMFAGLLLCTNIEK